MKRILFPTLAVLISFTLSGSAQMAPPSAPVPAALAKCFGNVTAFSAKCEVRVLDRNDKEKFSAPAEFALLDGKFRMELDFTQVKGQGIQQEQAAMMKQMGMDKLVSITRPDRKMTTVVYPGMQACLNSPMTKEQTDAVDESAKVEKTEQGKETVDGHPCVKNKVVVTDSKGQTSEAFVWNATDMKDFPVQVQVKEKNNTVIMLYKDVKLAKPAADKFEVPAAYTTYNNMQEFSAGMMQKMMGAAAKQ